MVISVKEGGCGHFAYAYVGTFAQLIFLKVRYFVIIVLCPLSYIEDSPLSICSYTVAQCMNVFCHQTVVDGVCVALPVCCGCMIHGGVAVMAPF